MHSLDDRLNLEQSRMNSPLVSRKATGVAMGAYQYVTPSVEDLIKIGMSMEEARVFNKKFTQFLARRHDPLASMTLSPPPTVPTFDQLLPVSPSEIKVLLNKVAVVKLNGGLGTRMGCHGPKAKVEVRDGYSFLDIAVRQVEYLNRTYGVDIPLSFMNSFHTQKSTERIVTKYVNQRVSIKLFNQSRFPRFHKDSLRLLPKPLGKKVVDKHEAHGQWYPPGSGDVFLSLYRSGLLDEYQKSGVEYIFISNVENVGGSIDPVILKSIVMGKEDFMLEVTERAASDTFGSFLVRDGGLLNILEASQISSDKVSTFDAAEFKYWNTNNMWINVGALRRLIEEDRLNLSLVENIRDLPNGRQVVQLENPAGSIIRCFPRARALEVPRSRMRNVKSTAGLFPLQSNLFELEEDGQLVMSPKRAFPTLPLIKLGEHFHDINEYMKRFPDIPDILELDRLTVAGDVRFGRNISLKGTVVIVANPGEKIDIPSGCVLENKIVTGSLRIHDH
jgi:UTP--glucose-1-phosphate uridylyltransferase